MSNIPQNSNSGNGIYLTKAQALALFLTPASIHSYTDGIFVPLTGGTMTGPLTINPGADSANLLLVKNHSAGSTLLRVDSTTNIIYGSSGATITDSNGYSKPNGLVVASNDYYNGWFQDTSGNNYLHIDGSAKKITASIDMLIQADFGGSDSTNKFQVKNKAGTNLFNIDTTNSLITTGTYFTVNASTGSIAFQPLGSTNGFRILSPAGKQLFNVDTTNFKMTFGGGGSNLTSANYVQVFNGSAKSIFNIDNATPSVQIGGTASGPTSTTMFQVMNGAATPVAVFNVDTTTPASIVSVGGSNITGSFKIIGQDTLPILVTSFTSGTSTFSYQISSNIIVPTSANSFDIGATANRYRTFYGNTLDLKTATNSTTAVNVANSSGTSVFAVDTTNSKVIIGGLTTLTTLSVQPSSDSSSVVTVKNSTGANTVFSINTTLSQTKTNSLLVQPISVVLESNQLFRVNNSSGTSIFNVDTISSVINDVNSNYIGGCAPDVYIQYPNDTFSYDVSGATSWAAAGLSATGLTKASITPKASGSVNVRITVWADYSIHNTGGYHQYQIQQVANNTASGTVKSYDNTLTRYLGSGDNGGNNAYMTTTVFQRWTGLTLGTTYYFDLIIYTSTGIKFFIQSIEVVETKN